MSWLVVVVLALIVVVIALGLRSVGATATPLRTDAPGRRSVAGVDAPEDAALGDAIRAWLEARGAAVSAIDHDYAVELEVDLDGETHRVSVGWVDDSDAPWKLFVDGVSGESPSERALQSTHAVLVALTAPSKVRWTTREADAAGEPQWRPQPLGT